MSRSVMKCPSDRKKTPYPYPSSLFPFKKTVHPGDQITLSIKFIKLRKNIWRFSARATVDEKLVASAEILTTVADA